MLKVNTEEMDHRAREILKQNDRGGYTVPTAGLYPYQWNWDSAFAALGFAEFDLVRAWQEIETLMAGQWDNGMVPHILFHQPDDSYFPGIDVWQCQGPIPSSGITQPPVAITVARMLFEKDPQFAKERVVALLPKFRAWVDWFMAWRSHEGAIFVTHPWESGRDNAPDWDEAMSLIEPEGVGEYQRRDTQHVDAAMRPTKYDYDRYIWLVQRGAQARWDDAAMAKDAPFRVADPTMTFILLRAVHDLVWLADATQSDGTGLAEHVATLTQGADTLWNEDRGHYDSFNCNTGTWSGALTNASFLCWFAKIDSDRMLSTLDRVFDIAPYGVPSLSPEDERFDGVRYWRGPSWCMMNQMIGMGLDEHGYAQGARLRAMTGRLIRNCGFAEYFEPKSGAAAGGKAFTWTAAVWLNWAGKD